ncbi:hypothetical protein [Candidatus Sulfurimonas baltica]|uniref:Uncharacterized protein n=1 Tax=Candidatus Sulfurimonas baltica TaxID=2740404 RepID=A0A7S7RN77_9BACT|nr:hypothetical protein [Candidatus Sulfurimonas baltica]QOY53037.1 hypothetical protein HUE88_04970 [Candidatus Sulfurimonas baltica]
MKILFTQFTSLSRPVVKTYKKDFTKSIGAAMFHSKYQVLQVQSLQDFDIYLNQMSVFETITLGLPKSMSGVSKTAKEYNKVKNPDFIYRGKTQVKYLNDIYDYIDDIYSLYFIDIDYDKSQPKFFKMSTPQDVEESLYKLIPELQGVQLLIRPSSSAGIFNSVTGERRSDKPSWHIYFVVSHTTVINIDNLTEYIKRRSHREDVNLAYIKQSKSNANLERFYCDLAVADASRIIVEATPILEAPLQKEFTPSVITDGGVLNLSKIDFTSEPLYKTVHTKINSNKNNHSTLNTHPTHYTNNKSLQSRVLVCTDEDKERILSIYKYLKQTDKPIAKEFIQKLNDGVVSLLLQHLGYEVDANYKFKMREEKTHSASIRYDGYLRDFGSNFSGTIINFMMEVYSLKFIEVWNYLQNCFGKNKKLSIKTQVALPDAKAFEKSLQTQDKYKDS